MTFLMASQGCPHSCSYYCAYGAFQGSGYRTRSPELLLKDIIDLRNNFGIKSVQFRDPLFGLNITELKRFCLLLIENNLDVQFGIETRLDLLNKELLNLMFAAGLRSINVGIETINKSIANQNNRLLISERHQEEIIGYCEKIGIKVVAFYLFGLPGDTEESIKSTISYAIRLNTNMARFGSVCPYPGTKFYDELDKKNIITETDFEKFDSFNLVFKHDKLSAKQIANLLNFAHRRYYLRVRFVMKFIIWKIREFYL
jgi:radical SAM superfamily enzyme YgiQ (UPF0313 family)